MNRLLLLGAVLLCLTACKDSATSGTEGEAYIAPASVNLRGDIAQKNTVAVLKHGDRVQVLDQKRRFVQVRTPTGVTGWMDALQLLTPVQMSALQKEHAHALTLPSMGAASVYETLNIHLEPGRQSPAFAQIPEGGFVQVLQYKLVPRTTAAAKPPVFEIDRPQPEHRDKRKKEGKPAFRLPPKPAPPGLPPNYQELSPSPEPPARPSASALPPAPEKPTPMEEWTLVRTKYNQTGWVLSRNLYMAIPDDVAQYAEGKRITSYFNLGEVKDEEKGLTKHDWLWTTLSEPGNYDFDAWRVFVYSRHHHRFETSYRMRDLEGYFPVQVSGREFAIITKDDDGKLRKRTYNFDGTLVHLAQTEDYTPEAAQSKNAGNQGSATGVKQSWFSRLWNRLRGRR